MLARVTPHAREAVFGLTFLAADSRLAVGALRAHLLMSAAAEAGVRPMQRDCFVTKGYCRIVALWLAVLATIASVSCDVAKPAKRSDATSPPIDEVAAVLDSLATAHPCFGLPYRVLFDSRYWSAEEACGVAAVAVNSVETFADTVGAYIKFAVVADSVWAVSVKRQRICGAFVGQPLDTTIEFRRHYAFELDVKNRDQLFTVLLDPVTLTAVVGAVHRGSFLTLSGPAPPPEEDSAAWTRDPCR